MIILAKDLKNILNEEKIQMILENLGCHHIKLGNNKIQSAMPDGDNPTAICIYTNENPRTNAKEYKTEIFTRSDFQSKEIRDIITLVEFIENKNKEFSFSKAVKKICDICDLDYYYENKVKEQPLLKWMNSIDKNSKYETEDMKLNPLSESILNQFYINPVQKWIDDGIDESTQMKYQIGFDPQSERIVIPIRDELGVLVGIKGRLINDENINNDKYIYLYNCPKSKLLFGLDKNEKNIKEKNEVIIVEAEKGVMKLDSLGFNNSIGTGGKLLFDTQIEKILRLGVPITIAYDQDVSDSEIIEIVKRLQFPIPTVPIFIIKDVMGFLQEKESPFDNSETWNILYNNYKEKINV